jgi:Leucine Rich repeat
MLEAGRERLTSYPRGRSFATADEPRGVRLNLSGTQVTDAGLRVLAGLSKFTVLDLQNTKVTDEGVAELRKSLPHCYIFHRFRNRDQ